MMSEVVHRLPHAAVGGLLGGIGGGYEAFSSNEPLRQRIQELEAKPSHSRGEVDDLGQLRARLLLAEHAKKHPASAIGAGALSGALGGAVIGPSAVNAVGHIGAIGKYMKDIIKGAG